ncbi:MAG: hypothetical protein KQH79_06550 [Bacteroidetes bacterium]|nr:hypothetical protein [Bacteroidota bacterium]
MKSDKFSLKLFIYLVVLSASGFAFFWSFSSSQLIITRLVFALTFILFFIFMLRYINRTNRDLVQFLESIQYLDNVSSGGTSSDLSFEQLHSTYHKITDQLKKAWIEKEQEHQYFQYTLENIAVGVLSFKENGKIELFNKTAKDLLGVDKLENIRDLDTIGDKLISLKPNESKLIKQDTSIDQLTILAKASNLKIGIEKLKLVTLQDIKTQLEQSELEAWQKLIKVLTHEMMNSVTPIKSLTYSMQKMLNADDEQEIKNENLEKGLQAIEKRSKGLLDFVESYKNLTQIQKPSYQRVLVRKLVDHIHQLFKEEFENQNIQFKSKISDDLSVIADEKLISQVIINLIQNSMKAFVNQSDKIIEIKAVYPTNKKLIISIRDNGDGIDPEIMDKIFVPFFSTREQGSGIGLSFARQVMVLHNGRIDVKSIKGEGTEFALTF